MPEADVEHLEKLRAGGFTAIDWGSSKGGSIEHIRKRFGLEDIVGIDMDPRKIAKAREAGRTVIEADATTIDVGKGNVVDTSFMFHFLEHLPTVGHAESVLRNACLASRRAVVVRQPMFGDDETLMRVGLKFAWSTWSGHPNRMTTLDFYRVFRKLADQGLVSEFRIGYSVPVPSTAVEYILPIDTPNETVSYDPALHGPKPDLRLSGLHKEVCVVARTTETIDWADMATKVNISQWICEYVVPEGGRT